MRIRIMIPALFVMTLCASVSVAQTAAAVIAPAAIAIPLFARLATGRHMAPPECAQQVVVASKNNYVCANAQIDWSAYGRVEVTSIDLVPANAKKPLTDHEVEQLKTAFAESLRKQFRHDAKNGAGRTLNVRATITDVTRSNKALNIVTLAAIQAPVSFGGASAHIEIADGASGVILAEMTLRGRGRQYDVIPSVQSLGYAKSALNRESKQINKDIEVLRNKFNTTEMANANPE